MVVSQIYLKEAIVLIELENSIQNVRCGAHESQDPLR